MTNKLTIPYPFSKPTKLFDWTLFSVVLFFSALFAWYVYAQGMTMVMVDQYSHMSIARQVTDSLTPGISQLGFWPPLLHIVMIPFAAIDGLYESGLAAAVVLVPLLTLSCVMLYHLTYVLTQNRPISLGAVAVYVLNPYVLYFSVTPMTDMFYIAIMIIATYFFIHWWKTDSLLSLLSMGFLVGISPMARFEGFALIAMVGLFVVIRLWMRNVSYYKLESVTILYGLLAMIGVAFILVYGLIFNGNPLAFLNDEWSAYEQQLDFFLPTKHSIDISLLYLVHAGGHMIGWTLLVIAWVSFLCAAIFVHRDRMLFVAVAMILASPFLFDWLAMIQGSVIIQLPELPPEESLFFNERYGVYLIAFAAVIPSVVAAAVYQAFSGLRWYTVPVGMFAAGLVMMVALNGSLTLLKDVACDGCFDVIKKSRQVSPPSHGPLAEALRKEYDGGNILITRALHNQVVVESGIPLQHYVTEANEFYYDQAVAYPWLFARYVVMYSDDINTGNWYIQRERVSREWAGSPQFDYYYEQIYTSGEADLFKLRDARVHEFAYEHGIDTEDIPSLKREDPNTEWDVQKTFGEFVKRIDLE